MIRKLSGEVHQGVIFLDHGAELPEGTRVVVEIDDRVPAACKRVPDSVVKAIVESSGGWDDALPDELDSWLNSMLQLRGRSEIDPFEPTDACE